jgi:hypothetical protein
MSATGSPPGDWKPDEHKFREDEVKAATITAHAQVDAAKAQKHAIRWQSATVIVAFVSIVVSAVIGARTVHDSSQAAKSAQAISIAQADQNQLAIAMNAIGSDQSSQRIAGLLLLERNAITGLTSLPQGRDEAFNRYGTALQIFGSYIQDRSPVPTVPSPGNTYGFGPGYGVPSRGSTTIDLYYAARQLQKLLTAQDSARNLHVRNTLTIDISNGELWGVDWTDIRFDWLSGVFLRKIDLRSADLADSRWGKADLENSYLQCADLRRADLRGANLTGADLRGADVDGADLTGAKLDGANLTVLFGKAKGLSPGKPARSWNLETCGGKQGYWDNLPK